MTIKEFDIESMGTPKEPSKLKSRRLNVRLTEADMETVRRNCAIAGYKSISRFVIASIVDVRGRGRTRRQEEPGTGVPQWIDERMEVLTRQLKGIASNYNQAVTVMNTLVRSIGDRKVQQQIIRRAARLDTLTKEAVATLHDIRGMVGELKEAAGKDGEE